MKHFKEIKITLLRGVIYTILHFVLIFQLSGCFLKQDRTTVVYGSITDQKGQPVDSIMIMISGLKLHNGTTLNEMYSDKEGNYEMAIDVPKKFGTINVSIPFLSMKNPKFYNLFDGMRIEKNDVVTNNCCVATVGEKTKYDFQLIPK